MKTKQVFTYIIVLIILIVAAIGLSKLGQITKEISLDENNDMTFNIPESWQLYEDSQLGFSIWHPQEMNISEAEAGPDSVFERAVEFSLWGPTQERDTEFFDGITFTMRSKSIPENQNLRDYVEKEMSKPHTNPLGSHPTRLSIDNREAWAFRASGEIGLESRYVYIRDTENAVLQVIYSAPDPGNLGFEDVASMMLSSVEL